MLLNFPQCTVLCARIYLWWCGCPFWCVCCCSCGQSVAMPPTPPRQTEDQARTERRPAGKWNVHKLMLRWRNVGKARVPWPHSLPPKPRQFRPLSHPLNRPTRLKFGTLFARVCRFVKRVSGWRRRRCLSTGADWKCHTFRGTRKRPRAALRWGSPSIYSRKKLACWNFHWIQGVLLNVTYGNVGKDVLHFKSCNLS